MENGYRNNECIGLAANICFFAIDFFCVCFFGVYLCDNNNINVWQTQRQQQPYYISNQIKCGKNIVTLNTFQKSFSFNLIGYVIWLLLSLGLSYIDVIVIAQINTKKTNTKKINGKKTNVCCQTNAFIVWISIFQNKTKKKKQNAPSKIMFGIPKISSFLFYFLCLCVCVVCVLATKKYKKYDGWFFSTKKKETSTRKNKTKQIQITIDKQN